MRGHLGVIWGRNFQKNYNFFYFFFLKKTNKKLFSLDNKTKIENLEI